MRSYFLGFLQSCPPRDQGLLCGYPSWPSYHTHHATSPLSWLRVKASHGGSEVPCSLPPSPTGHVDLLRPPHRPMPLSQPPTPHRHSLGMCLPEKQVGNLQILTSPPLLQTQCPKSILSSLALSAPTQGTKQILVAYPAFLPSTDALNTLF